ncbi:MAG: AAA family ATPase [Anaerolineae bacterium]
MSNLSPVLVFIFTDIEGSTRLWEQYPEAMKAALARHDALIRRAVEAHRGRIFKTLGDQFCAVFASAQDALAAALAAQRALLAESWGEIGALRVRMALHTGQVEERDGDYFGIPLARVARILVAGHGGQILLSQATAGTLGAPLPPDVQLRDLSAHRLKDLVQPEHIYQLLAPDLPSDFPPLRSLQAFQHNLPIQLTRLIGRQRELAEARRRLTTARLLTLTGVGGTGKTRLSLQLAAEVLDNYEDGVWLVELAPLSDANLVAPSIARALGLREETGRPLLDTLIDYLRPRNLLLILDNCEHLIQACAQVAEALLHACPRVQILASSREGLGITGETSFHIPSLSLPDMRHLPSYQALAGYEGIQLFVERAQAVAPSFVLTEASAPLVAQICQRLDGIPLAIELAAARIKALPAQEVLARLDDRFRLLTGGNRAALPRQQTLQALIDWSYDLLSPEEQALLRRLSVFAGGLTLEAAEAVCGDREKSATSTPSVALPPQEVFDLLTHLVDKSLVIAEQMGPDEAYRYRTLETIRQYARAKLVQARESEAARMQHLDFFLRLAETAGTQLRHSDQKRWLDRLQAEHDNLRAALEWSTTSDERAEAGLRIACSLWRFWEVRGYWGEGRAWFERLLEFNPTARTALRARALARLGYLAGIQGDTAGAYAYLAECESIARELNDKEWLAWALVGAGALHNMRDDPRVGMPMVEAGLALFREFDDHEGIAAALSAQGECLIFKQSAYASARAIMHEAVVHFDRLGDRLGSAGALAFISHTYLQQGDDQAAQLCVAQYLPIFREMDDKPGLAGALINAIRVASHMNDLDQAQALAEELLSISQELGFWSAASIAFSYLGYIAMARGDLDSAQGYRETGLRLCREHRLTLRLPMSLGELAEVYRARGDYDTARRLNQEGLDSTPEQDRGQGRVVLLHNRGHILNRIGEYDLAIPALTRSLDQALLIDVKALIVGSILGLGGSLAGKGAAREAVYLLAAVNQSVKTLKISMDRTDQADYEHYVAVVRAQLDPAAFEQEWATGCAMTFAQAVDHARALFPPRASEPGL